MRILALMTNAYGGSGGIAAYNRDLLQALAECPEVEAIDVLVRGEEGPLPPLPEKTTQHRARPSRVAYAFQALRLAVRRPRPDIVLCAHLNMAPLGALVSRSIRRPLWLQAYGFEAWGDRGHIARRAARRASLITAISRYTRARFLAWADVDPTRVRVLPCTLEDRFAPGEKPTALLDRHGLHGKKILLTVSRLAAAEAYKGHDRILRALPTILEREPETLYLVAGDGDDRPRLEGLAAELGVDHAVRFLGRVPHGELPDLYRAADLFVMPSTGEGFGIVYLEAMACGVPALGFGRDGSRDPLQDGRLGIQTMEAELPEAILQALQRTGPPDLALAARIHATFGKDRFRHACRLQIVGLPAHTRVA